VSLLDDTALDVIRGARGLRGIAISHPHYYTTMLDWSAAFGHCPIYLHEADRRWVMRPGDVLEFWSGESRSLFGGLQLVRCGGHFAGGTVLHWRDAVEGRGALLSGDTVQVVPDRRWVSFMYSYPNYIPLDRGAVLRIVPLLKPSISNVSTVLFPS